MKSRKEKDDERFGFRSRVDEGDVDPLGSERMLEMIPKQQIVSPSDVENGRFWVGCQPIFSVRAPR